MPKKDIYKLDNILVPAGWIILLFWGPTCAGILLAHFGPGPHLVLCLAPVAMLVAGYRVRAKENRYFALWRILEKASRITVGELVQSTHFTAEEIKEGIRTINSTGRAIFSLEPHSGEIVNSGMNHTAAQESVECPNCGARNEESVFLGTTTAKCEYCGEMFQRSAEASSPPTPHRYVRRSNRGRAIRRTLNSTWVYL